MRSDGGAAAHLSGSSSPFPKGTWCLRSAVQTPRCPPSSYFELNHPQPQPPAPQNLAFGLNTKEREQ